MHSAQHIALGPRPSLLAGADHRASGQVVVGHQLGGRRHGDVGLGTAGGSGCSSRCRGRGCRGGRGGGGRGRCSGADPHLRCRSWPAADRRRRWRRRAARSRPARPQRARALQATLSVSTSIRISSMATATSPGFSSTAAAWPRPRIRTVGGLDFNDGHLNFFQFFSGTVQRLGFASKGPLALVHQAPAAPYF